MFTILVVAICVIPLCITVFAFTRKRRFDTINDRESLSYTLQQEDELYSIKRSKSALRSKDKIYHKSNKSVQFNEVVLEVVDLFNEEEPEKPYYSKVIKSSLKNEKLNAPIRCSKTMFPKTLINEYNGEIIDLKTTKKEEEKPKENNPILTKSEFPEIVIIKNDKKFENKKDNFELFEQKNYIAETVITSMANEKVNPNFINIDGELKPKANTLPRKSRPNFKGHRRQSSVRLTCIY